MRKHLQGKKKISQPGLPFLTINHNSYPPQATGSDATALGDMESSPNHLRRDEGTEATRDRDAEVEAATDAVVAAADAAHVQWVAQDKHRSNTVGHQVNVTNLILIMS